MFGLMISPNHVIRHNRTSAILNKTAFAFHLFDTLYIITSSKLRLHYLLNTIIVSSDIKLIRLDQKHVRLARQASPFTRCFLSRIKRHKYGFLLCPVHVMVACYFKNYEHNCNIEK